MKQTEVKSLQQRWTTGDRVEGSCAEEVIDEDKWEWRWTDALAYVDEKCPIWYGMEPLGKEGNGMKPHGKRKAKETTVRKGLDNKECGRIQVNGNSVREK